MRFKCNHCSKELNIADDKLPDAVRFKVKCPQCSNEIVIDRSDKPSKAVAAPLASETMSIEPDVFPPGSKVVFLFLQDANWRDAARSFFQRADFHISTADTPQIAVLKLRLNDYNVIMFEDRPDNTSIFEEIAAWSGLRRRSVNLILLSNEVTSMDPKKAFEKGVNSYLNSGDLDRASDHLEHSLIGYEEYYRWFFEAAKEE